MRDRVHWLAAALVASAIATVAPTAAAQQPAAPPKRPPRAGQTIVIRGQVPTPQVVTVRPRAVPQYDPGQLGLAPTGALGAGLTAGYQVVSQSQVSGNARLDSLAAMTTAGPGIAPAAPGAARQPAAPSDSQARVAELESIRQDLAVRRARLDSLERAARAEEARARGVDTLAPLPPGAPPPPPPRRMSAADSAARAAEIQELLKELAVRRARLDSLEAVVRSLGVPRGRPDSSTTPPDSTRPPRP